MNGMRAQAVLFDFDGTLTRPGVIDFSEMKRAIGCPEGIAVLEYLAKLPSRQAEEYRKIVEEMEAEAAVRSFPNDGCIDLLHHLKGRKLPFGLVTRNGLRSVVTALRNFVPIERSDFAAIVTRDDARPKPDPQGLLLAARSMKVDAAGALFVGDNRFDVMAGRAAGMFTVLLTNGAGKSLLPGDPQPHREVVRLAEIMSLLAPKG